MRIEDIDKNFEVKTAECPPDTRWYNITSVPFCVHGVLKDAQGWYRMPRDIANTVNEGVAWLNTNTSGGRIRFCTDSPYIMFKAVMPDNATMPHMTMTGQSGFDMYSESGYITTLIPQNRDHGFEVMQQLDGKKHTYTINMPLYDPVEEVYIGLKQDALLAEPTPYAAFKPVLYYGSSITQGGCASRPGNAYPTMISRKLNVDFVNLGFSGSARAEDTMIAYLCAQDPSVFVYDYDHNTPDAAYLEKSHGKLFAAFRAAHPDTPVIFVSKPDFNAESDQDIARRGTVMNTYLTALRGGDNKVWFVDGARLFDGEFADSCTVDGCHPNDLGFYRMAMNIGRAVAEALGLKW